MTLEQLNKLDSIYKVNGLLSVTIESFISKEITESRAKTIQGLCNTLIKGLQVEDLETRIEKLERVIDKRQKGI